MHVPLPVILCAPERQLDRAAALAQYCWDLDGTYVRLIVISQQEDDAFEPEYPANRFHSLQSSGLHRAACEASGPFIWLEADASPLKSDWAAALTKEYKLCGKKFLLSSDSQPFDVIGGIGVYPKETEWLVPVHFPKSGWDLWLLECVPHLLARTPLIQHSYGIYNDLGQATEHRFPRDNKMLRREAVIFHRDPFQDLPHRLPHR